MASILECPIPKTFTDIRSFTGAVGHYRCFIKGFAKITVPLYDLTSGENKDKKSEPVTLTPEALEAFQILKDKYVQAPVLAFPDFKKPFLLETDTSGKGLGAFCSRSRMMDAIIPLHLPVGHSLKLNSDFTPINRSSWLLSGPLLSSFTSTCLHMGRIGMSLLSIQTITPSPTSSLPPASTQQD